MKITVFLRFQPIHLGPCLSKTDTVIERTAEQDYINITVDTDISQITALTDDKLDPGVLDVVELVVDRVLTHAVKLKIL